MKRTPWLAAEPYRIQHPFAPSTYGDDFGAFQIMGPCGRELKVIVSAARDTDEAINQWDHVSVSLNNRCPNWLEMCFIKDIFFDDDEMVIQYHPAKKDYVDCHPHCLHLWRPLKYEIPMPPSIMVAPDSFKKGKLA